MPVHDAVVLAQGYLDEPATTGSPLTGPGIGRIRRPMRGAYQPAPSLIKETVGLVIHLHRHVGTTVEVRVHLSVKTNRKGSAGGAGVHHIKRNSQAAVDQVARWAQGNQRSAN